jgi:hypothetical protein
MKKIIIISLSFVALFIGLKADAQVANTSYWNVFGGGAVPTGQFANSNYGELYHENNKAGFAKTGVAFGLDGAFYIKKTNWAIGVTVTYQDQGQLNSKDVNALAEGYQDAFDVDQGAVTSTGRYKSLSFLAGPQYSFLFGKLALDLRANAGLIKSLSTPAIDVVVTDDDIDHPFAQESSKSSAFAYGGSAGLRYNFTKKFGLILKENYLASPGISITNTERVNNAGRLDNKQPISLVQTTLGLNFSF